VASTFDQRQGETESRRNSTHLCKLTLAVLAPAGDLPIAVGGVQITFDGALAAIECSVLGLPSWWIHLNCLCSRSNSGACVAAGREDRLTRAAIIEPVHRQKCVRRHVVMLNAFIVVAGSPAIVSTAGSIRAR